MTLLFALMAISVTAAAEPLTELGKQQLEADWLLQCGDKPTPERTLDEIGWARDLAARLAELKGADKKKLKGLVAKLDPLAKKVEAKQDDVKEIYLDVRRVKREIAFSNPLINFDQIALIDNPYPNGIPGDATNEWQHEARHRNGYMAQPGGRLLVVGLNPDEVKRDLFEGKVGTFWRPDVDFSGEKIVVSFQPEEEKSFHLYEVDKEGKEVKQLTYGDYSDLDPIYSPDGKILFCTERGHTYIRCMPMTHGYQLARCDADGKNIYVLSRNGEADYLPVILNDGRVIYTRWEYTEKALWRVQSLWTTNPDGTNVQIFWGNQSVWPDMQIEARPIPNSRRVMFTGAGHHRWFDGPIGIIDPDKGLDFPDGLTKVTPQVAWAEVGNGPDCENETDKNEEPAKKYHENNGFVAYKTPYPLSEEDFLCSARHHGLRQTREASKGSPFFSLYLMDVYGNRELIYEGKYNAYHAMPLCKREKPPVLPDRVQWPKIGSSEKPANGILYSNDVFAGAPEVLRGKGKYIRVVQMDPKNYSTWHKTLRHFGPSVSAAQADGVKRFLGTVPIEKDGSIAMELPPGEALIFQMLDKNKQAIHVMRSFTGVMPGEVRGCFGCHESKLTTRGNLALPNQSIAMKKGAVKPTPPAWGYETSISYARFVQPVLDKYCVKCHNDPENKAYAKLNMTVRPSKARWRSNANTRPGDVSPFTEPYYSLVDGDRVYSKNQKMKEDGRPEPNPAGIFMVEGMPQNDPVSLATLPPYSAFSPTSMLVKNASSGKHGKGVKVAPEDLAKLVAWVDANGPYLGDEEIREMYDPQTWAAVNVPAVRPRVATAPKINRFNIRQDGDSNAVANKPLKIAKNLAPLTPPRSAAPSKPTKDMKKAMAEKNVKVEIIKATYGAGDKWIDVTKELAKRARKSRYIEVPRFNSLAGDPIQGTPKRLKIEYKVNGVAGKVELSEKQPILLPTPKKK